MKGIDADVEDNEEPSQSGDSNLLICSGGKLRADYELYET